MKIVPESVGRRVVEMADAIDAVEQAFAAFDRQEAEVLPVVVGAGFAEGDKYGVKTGSNRAAGLIGAKFGSYWASNLAKGLPAHASTTMLFDHETGRVHAVVDASYLTCLRTAASDAVAVKHLARQDVEVLGVVGAGHQALYEVLAVRHVRDFGRVLVSSRTMASAERLVGELAEHGVEAEATSMEEAARAADVLVTVTTARQPVVRKEWLKPGVHVSAMGADAPGKHELDPQAAVGARLFADVVEQAVTIGELEPAFKTGLIRKDAITPIGAVINGRAQGRGSADEITIYDSSGMALQDLAICQLALERAEAEGLVVEVED